MKLLKDCKLTIMTLCLGLLFATPLYAAEPETVYPMQDRTAILAQPSGFAKIVAKVDKGEALKVIGKSGKYYRVKTSKGVSGYVFKMRVTEVAPSNPESDDDDFGLLETEPRGGSQVTLGESSSSHSIRGLRKATSKKGKGATGTEADDAVNKMEHFKVSGGELKKFQREGDVGRYAR